MTKDDSLVSLLAKTDVLFAPFRQWEPRNASAVVDRQIAYRTIGLPYSAGGDPNERQRAKAAADALESEGKVIFIRNQYGVRIGWRLADREIWRLRHLCLLDGEVELIRVMAAMLENFAVRHVRPNTGFVPEATLAGTATKSNLLRIEEALTPGLVLGLVEAATDTQGRVFYAITTKGHQFTTGWQRPSFTPPRYNAKRSKEAAVEYLRQSQIARRELESLRGDSGHVVIPLAAGCGPTGTGVAALDAKGRLI